MRDRNIAGMGGSFIGTVPCQGDELFEIRAPANEVFHVTAAGQRSKGDFIPPFRIHFSATGRVLAVPVDGNGQTPTAWIAREGRGL